MFIGWPTSLGTTDLLFLLPVPWFAPVSAPIIASLALIGFGLIAALRLNRGEQLVFKVKDWLTLSVGGVVVILSFTLDAGHILNGGMPRGFLWPISESVIFLYPEHRQTIAFDILLMLH